MRLRAWVTLIGLSFCVAHAADSFPERKTVQAARYSIEYSAGDEVYATALAKLLPLDLTDAPTTTSVPPPLSVLDLRVRRAEVLKLLSGYLALPNPTPRMSETFDAFIESHVSLQHLQLMDTASRFALWRKPELVARLAAGQDIAGFRRAPDGGIEFSMQTSFDFEDGESPETSLARLRENLGQLTWPIKIGEPGSGSPDAEVRQRVSDLIANAAQMSVFQSPVAQRKAVLSVLHETVETTLATSHLHSPDRRWFCEGVANYLAYRVIAQLEGAGIAREYYDVDAELSHSAAFKDQVHLQHWPVSEDAKAKAMPPDLTSAHYAFAAEAVFNAFGDGDLLAKVLAEVGKTPKEKASMDTVYAAYLKVTGKDLRSDLRP